MASLDLHTVEVPPAYRLFQEAKAEAGNDQEPKIDATFAGLRSIFSEAARTKSNVL